jgi:hypothetical protein
MGTRGFVVVMRDLSTERADDDEYGLECSEPGLSTVSLLYINTLTPEDYCQ